LDEFVCVFVFSMGTGLDIVDQVLVGVLQVHVNGTLLSSRGWDCASDTNQ
jgi:hypothetical protein